MPIQHQRISKGIEKAQKKVEERNFEARKSLLEYDEVMDFQRRLFYGNRRRIIEGKGLKETIQTMIQNMVDGACKNILARDYPQRCIAEWAKTEFGVELEPKRMWNMELEQIEEMIRDLAGKNVTNDISVSLGEYLEDYDDPKTWQVDSLVKWAMSAFKVQLSAAKVRQMNADQIETTLTEAACKQVDKKDASRLVDFLKEDFAARAFGQWVQAKFDIDFDTGQIKDQTDAQVRAKLTEAVNAKYSRREVEYPVEFALNMVYGPQGPNMYAFEALAQWANKKYDADVKAETLAEMPPKEVQQMLLEMSRQWHDGKLERTVESKVRSGGAETLAAWAKERFGAEFTPEQLKEPAAKELLMEAGREFLRKELTELERYVLLQIYDSTWKDHLYGMDRLKESIMLRAYAEKDPKIEYKHEGHRMFQEMLESIDDRVTNIIFRVRLESGQQQRSRNVYQVSHAKHDDVNQFEATARQRAAAQAPQGEIKVKQITLDQPKVGRNDPCPCGSGKKYKRCCGMNA
ncbi:MAG: SEC-C domain-containing protein [Planctomycetaceae bacterium]|nr:SEC-C domain-containing protein [Planctomycetaceae bacterium]